jgi:hypothetical protein
MHLVPDAAADQDQHAGDAEDRLDGRVLLAVLDLEAHPLLVDPHLALDAGAPLGLLQAHLVIALALFLRLVSRPDAVLLVADPLLLRLAGAPFRVLSGLPLGLRLGAGGLLLLLDPVVLDPSQLAQRKQDRVLTWTLAAAHGRGLTISVTRFAVCFNATSFRTARKIRAARQWETHRGSGTI